jgi:cellulose biosynthesis protein BcsQ
MHRDGPAWALDGLKVLMIDGDAQCNLTSFYHEDNDAPTIETADLEVINAGANLCSFIQDDGVRILGDELSEASASKMSSYISEIHQPALLQMFKALFDDKEAGKIKEIVQKPSSFICVNPDSFGGNLWLLEGDSSISEYEGKLSMAEYHKDTRLVTVLNHIMNECEKAYGFDVILIDVNPGNSVFNKFAAAACDFVLPPGQVPIELFVLNLRQYLFFVV